MDSVREKTLSPLRTCTQLEEENLINYEIDGRKIKDEILVTQKDRQEI